MCRKKSRKLSTHFQPGNSKHFFEKKIFLKIHFLYNFPALSAATSMFHVCRNYIDSVGMEESIDLARPLDIKSLKIKKKYFYMSDLYQTKAASFVKD